MISTGELRKGVTIELDNELWQILDYHHIKMGRGSAQVRITLRNIKRGQTIERSFQAGTKWPRAQLENRPVQFLYRDGDDFHFMDTDNYDQFMLRFHDYLKGNDDFQERCAKRYWHFPPNSMWLVITDTASHAVLRGRYALEHSYFVAPHGLAVPDESPTALLAKLCAERRKAA